MQRLLKRKNKRHRQQLSLCVSPTGEHLVHSQGVRGFDSRMHIKMCLVFYRCYQKTVQYACLANSRKLKQERLLRHPDQVKV